MIKTHIASFALAASLFGGAAVGTVAAQPQGGTQRGGAAGVVAAVVQAVANVNVEDNVVAVDVVELDNALNNLRALNNVLNNSPILSQNDIDITVQDVSVLTLDQVAILEDADILVTEVIGVAVLSGGDIIVFR
jgi:hypothetical protein